MSRLLKLSPSFTILMVFCAMGAGDLLQGSSADKEGPESSTASNPETEGETSKADTDNKKEEEEKSTPSDKSKAPTQPAKPPRIIVVVSTKNPIESLTTAEVARIFLRKKTQWSNGWSITAYERPVKEKIRQRFSKKILNKKPEALYEYWMNLKLTRGIKPPKVLRSPKLVKRYLERVKGGIAYLYENEIDDTVKVIEIEKKS